MTPLSRFACTTALLLSLAGCASYLHESTQAGPTAGAAPMTAKGLRAGIVSVLGERPEHIQVGVGSAPHVQELDPPQGWSVDDYLETLVGRRLAARTGIEAVDARDADRAPFLSLAQFRPATDADLLDISRVRTAIATFAAKEKLDWVVLITPARLSTRDAPNMSIFGGYGKFGSGTLTGCHASVRVTIVDAKDGKLLKQGIASKVSRGEIEALRGKRLAQLSDTLRGDMRDCMLDSLDDVQNTALNRMGY